MNVTLVNAQSPNNSALGSIRHFSTEQPIVYHTTPNLNFDIWLLVKGDAHITGPFGVAMNQQASMLGMQTSSTQFVMQPHTEGFHLRFSPVQLYHLVGMPLRELTHQPVALMDLWGQTFHENYQTMVASPPQQAQLGLERLLLGRQILNRDTRLIQQVIRTIADDPASASVRQLCQSTGYAERQLQRLFDEQVGMSPRTFIKISRFQRAIALFAHYKRRKAPFTLLSVALEAGYFDQPHFIRDCRQFTNKTPEQYFWTMDPVLSGSYNPEAKPT
jgi:AraC-like DNA-binding protein